MTSASTQVRRASVGALPWAAAQDRGERLEAEREAARTARARRVVDRLRLVVPLLVVNAVAVYGQVAFAFASVAPPAWPVVGRLVLAAGFAAAVESIAVYVGWHAHDALLAKATVTAARLRRASYLVAAVVAAINYAHFAGPAMRPTAAGVAFGLLSLLSPWLWGLHTRREQHLQLRDSGAVDGIGAVFSAERLRAFPLRTWAARRWSIDYNVTDPVAAWRGYNAERAARRAAYPAGRWRTAWAAVRGTLPIPATTTGPPVPVRRTGTQDPVATGTGNPAGTGTPGGARTGTAATTTRRRRTGASDQRRTGTRTDQALLAALVEVPTDPDGTVPVRRAAAALGCGPDRARRLLTHAGLLRASNPTTPEPSADPDPREDRR